MSIKQYYTLIIDEYGTSIEEKDEVLQELSDRRIKLENKIEYLIESAIQNHDTYELNDLNDNLYK